MQRYVLVVFLLLFLVSELGYVLPVLAHYSADEGYRHPQHWYDRSNRFPKDDSDIPLVSDALVAAPLIAVILTVIILGYFAFRENRNIRNAIAHSST
jgi:hypothetical protein